MASVNETYTAVELLLDAEDGTAISGVLNASSYWTTKTAFQVDTPATTAAVTATSEGSGFYGFSFTPPTPTSGDPVTWAYHVVYDDGFTVREFVGSVDVASVSAVDAEAVVGARTTVSYPRIATSAIPLVAGDDYLNADGRALTWEITGGPSLLGATVTFKIVAHPSTVAITETATVTNAGESTQTAKVDLTDDDTTLLTPSGAKQYRYDLAAVLSNGDKVTLARGSVTVTADV